MELAIGTSKPRRKFKAGLGHANHFLITIMVGLDAVEDGIAELRDGFPTSWNPQDRKRSAERSRGFAARGAIALLIDSIDAYTNDVLRPPQLIHDDMRDVLLADNATDRFENLSRFLDLRGSADWALLNLGRAWRHRLLHSRSTAKLGGSVRGILRRDADTILTTFSGLNVEVLLKHFDSGAEPSFKETTSLIRAGQRFIEAADTELLSRLDLQRYAEEAVDSYVLDEDVANRERRVDNIWGKDPQRRRSSVLRVLESFGVSFGETGRPSSSEPMPVVDAIANQTHGEIVKRLGLKNNDEPNLLA